MDEELRGAWANWLAGMEWDYFLTVTFREPLPRHRGESVLHSLAMTLRKRFQPQAFFLGTEPHLSMNLHIHGLIRSGQFEDYRQLERQAMWKYLYDKFGRSQVALIRDTGDVAGYVSKYCVKATGQYTMY